MFVIGSHLSISKGYLHMGKEATKIGGNTFQYFTRNPRGGGMRALDLEDMMGIDLQAIKTIADQGSEYQITGQHITFEGVCPECAKKESH